MSRPSQKRHAEIVRWMEEIFNWADQDKHGAYIALGHGTPSTHAIATLKTGRQKSETYTFPDLPDFTWRDVPSHAENRIAYLRAELDRLEGAQTLDGDHE